LVCFFFNTDNLETDTEKTARYTDYLGRWRSFMTITLLEKQQDRNLLAHVLSANCKLTISRTCC